MGENFNDAEFLADTILQRVEQLIAERDFLRRELARQTSGTLAHDKEFVRAFQENVISNAAASEKIARLEHMLMIR